MRGRHAGARSSSSDGQACEESSPSRPPSPFRLYLPIAARSPRQNLIVFLTFCVICVTLVLQGITLPPLIRALGLAGAAGPNCEEQEARRIVIDAAVSHLNDAKEKDNEEAAALYEDLTGSQRPWAVS